VVSRDLVGAGPRRVDRPADSPAGPARSPRPAAGPPAPSGHPAGSPAPLLGGVLPAAPVAAAEPTAAPAAEGGSGDDGDGSSPSPGPNGDRDRRATAGIPTAGIPTAGSPTAGSPTAGSGCPGAATGIALPLPGGLPGELRRSGPDAELLAGGRLAVLARAAAENFPVAPAVLPRALRRDLMAVYGYARLVDQLGDEAPGERAALLDEVAADVDRLAAGRPPRLSLVADLAPLVARGTPVQPLHDLLEANRRDQRCRRYRTFAELLDYCRYSADPVGRLVLHAVGAATPERITLSDRVCTALQIIEHLQDVAEDRRNGRVYLPAEDLERYGVTDDDLGAPVTSPRLRSLIGMEADRAGRLLRAGASLAGTLRGAARVAVAGFVGGGVATLHALEQSGYDVLPGAPKAARRSMAAAAIRCWAVGR
jgi:squalene synthase HpnC